VEGNAVSGKVGIYIRTLDGGNYNIVSGNGLSGSTNAIKHDSAGSNTTYANNAIQGGTIDIVSGRPNLVHAKQANSFTWNSETPTFTVDDTSVTANSVILLFSANAAAAKLVGGARSPYISGKTAGKSFIVSTADGGNAAGTEVFNYLIVN